MKRVFQEAGGPTMHNATNDLLRRYGSGVLSVLLATLLRWLIDPLVDDRAPFVTYLLAVGFAAWYGGIGPALLTLALGIFAAGCFFLTPRYEPWTALVDNTLRVGLFVVVALATALFIEGLHASRKRALATARELLHKKQQLEEEIAGRRRMEASLREGESHFRQLADAMPQIVWTTRTDGGVDYYNRRWYEYTGFPETTGEDNRWQAVLHPEELEAVMERWAESVRLAKPFEMEYRLRHASGRYRWHLGRTLPARDEVGQIVRWFGTSTDIHDTKQAAEAAHFLAEASAALATLVDYQSTLQKVANLAVPFFADWCAVDLGRPGQPLRRLAVAHLDPAKVRLAEELMRRWPPDPEEAVGSMRVLRTGEPLIVEKITDDMLVQGARDAEQLRLVRELGLASYICVPLATAARTLGVVTFATAESGRHYTEADLRLAQDLGHRAAIAIENAELYAEQRETSRRKDEFLATLAHELRNPLAPIRNSLQIMQLAAGNEALIGQARDVMERQLVQMVRLIDDLLDVSRISRGKVELRKERVELTKVVQDAVETVQPAMTNAGHELTVTLPPEPIVLEADAVRLAQVLANLLSNSVKYTDKNGHIWLSATCEGSAAVVRVRDDGVGIPPEMLPRIFEMFTQVDRGLGRTQGGLGIGLTLVKTLVEMHGGSVAAHSDGPGRGSEFIVRLPLAFRARNGKMAAKPAPATAAPPAKRRILVVDDNRDAAESLAMLLRIMGHEVEVAHEGAQAIEMARSFLPDTAFLDIGMPGMNGYELAQRLRQEPALGRLMLVALTGWGQEEDRRRSQAAGFDHHLTKPAAPEMLRKLLEKS